MSDLTIEDIRKGCDAIARINRKYEWKMRLHDIPPYNQRILVSNENVLPPALVRKAESAGIPVHCVDYVLDDEAWLIGTASPKPEFLKVCRTRADNKHD